MTTHLVPMVVFALLVSIVFAVLLRDEPREQVRSGGLMFGGFVAAALAMSWLLLLFPLP